MVKLLIIVGLGLLMAGNDLPKDSRDVFFILGILSLGGGICWGLVTRNLFAPQHPPKSRLQKERDDPPHLSLFREENWRDY